MAYRDRHPDQFISTLLRHLNKQVCRDFHDGSRLETSPTKEKSIRLVVGQAVRCTRRSGIAGLV